MRAQRFRTFARVFGLGLAALLSGNAAEAGLPKDPCALLNVSEIEALAPGAEIGNGTPDTSMGALGNGCTYTWGPRSRDWGESAVSVTIIDASQAYPGTSADSLREGLLAKAKAGGPDASVIAGVGEAAVFSFESRSSNATAEAYLKAKAAHVSVKYHAGDSLASKDKVIALLKDAAARL